MKLHRLAALVPILFALFGCTAFADESTIRTEFAKMFPGETIGDIKKMPFLGLYEIQIDDQILYTDANFRYLVRGDVIDVKTKTNLTEESQQKRLAVPFDQLPLDLAFKKVKGDGSRKLAVFSDPDCPYCKRLEQSLASIDNVTIYTFLYPLEQLHPKAPEVARAIWCSPDRVKAWDDYMLRKVAPKTAGTCDNPVDKIVQYGQGKRISGTPTLLFTDGKRVPGAIPLDQIESNLAKAQASN